MIRINCICFRRGDCLHQAAPRRLFGPARCVEVDERVIDPRIGPAVCKLRVAHQKPTLGQQLPKPPPPPPREVKWP